MAKLKGLFDKISSLEGQLSVCNRAYADLFDKYNKLYQKYSYEESMEKAKEINEIRRIEGKLIL